MMDWKTVRTSFSQARHRAWFGLAACCVVLTLLACSAAQAQTPDEPADTPPEAKPEQAPDKPAQAADKPTAKTHPNDPMIWDIEQMMEDAVMQIARRYNLNGQQEEYTRLLLKTRVREFLKDYEGEVRELLQESISMRTGKAPPDAAALQQWADRARPLYAEAMKAILDGNNEWGQILDADQKKIHDGDLALMQANALAVNTTLDTWSAGKGKFPVTAMAQNGAARTVSSKGEEGQVSDGGRQSVNQLIEDNWAAYVNTFIKVYQLTEKQQSSARDGILKDQRSKARQYRDANKEKFAKIEESLLESTPDKPKISSKQRLATLRQKNRELHQPIRELFVALDLRLKALLDSKQLAAVDPTQLKVLEAQYNMLANEPGEDAKQGKTNVKIKPDVPRDATTRTKAEGIPSSQPTAEPPVKIEPAQIEPAQIEPANKEPPEPAKPAMTTGATSKPVAP